ncbi:MAG: FKBP-type peptidyl-prolyl cis-trans isomerase [Crocinitomicaceae bacterium]|nr:FKBP-type peptidyl-prolyl cis-trans isomerase [Crocinitomicaceae bacterium]
MKRISRKPTLSQISHSHSCSCSKLLQLLLLLTTLAHNSCQTYSEEQKEAFSEEVEEYVQSHHLKTEQTETGLHYHIEVEGEGRTIKPTDRFILSYRGMLKDSTIFCQDTDTFKLHEEDANKRVILGWREGLSFFKKGGKGFLVIPPHLGYLNKEINVKCDETDATVIPGNSILIYEVEVLDVW